MRVGFDDPDRSLEKFILATFTFHLNENTFNRGFGVHRKEY